MSALLRKELRGLWPFFGLVVALGLLDFGWDSLNGFPDERPFEPIKWLLKEKEGAMMSIILVALMTGAGLLLNEEEMGTLAFLDGLPLSRTRVFLAKLITGYSVVVSMAVIVIAQDALFGALSLSSVSESFPWMFLCVETGLLLVAGTYVFAAALLLSYLRRWMFLGVGVVVWSFLWFEAKETPHFDLIDPFASTRPSLVGSMPVVPWSHVATQLAAATLMLGVAWLGFHRLGEPRRGERRGWRQVLAWAGAIAVPLVWIGVMSRLADKSPVSNSEFRQWHPGGESEFGRITSEHYEFIFHENQRTVAKELRDAGEAVFASVDAFFDHPPLESRIVVDLAGRVAVHADGQADWKKIRLPLLLNPEREDQLHVLAHETAHVLIMVAAGDQAPRRLLHAHWFQEGLATYVGLRFFPPTGTLEGMQHTAAAAHDWEPVYFSDLCEDAQWNRKRAFDAVYPLGRVWFEALVREYGDASPGRFVRAFARRAVAAETSREGAWRAALQSCGYDLEVVNAAFESLLDEAVAERRAWLDTLPRLTATVTRSDTDWLIEPKWKGDAPGRVVVRVSPHEPTGLGLLTVDLRADRQGVVHVPRSKCPGPSLWYQLGWRTDKGYYALCESWQEETKP